MTSFRIICIRQPDGTWYGGAHSLGGCVGSYGFASRAEAWLWANAKAIERCIEERLHADTVDDCPSDEEALRISRGQRSLH